MDKTKLLLKCKPFMEIYAESKGKYLMLCMVIAALLWGLGLMLKIEFLPLSFFLIVITISFFMLTKDLSDKQKSMRKNLNIALVTTAICIGEIFNSLIISIKFYPLLSISPIILISIIIVLFVGMTTNEQGKKIFMGLMRNDIYKPSGMIIEEQPGDVVIGADINTGNPVIIPLKDRYVHQIIYGPTGSGKTSQVLAPMMLRDLKNKDFGVICMEPKGDFANQVFAMAKLSGREDVVYFNPIMENCPYFNPLLGDEDDVIENLVTTFRTLDPDSGTFFKDNGENLIRRGTKVIKRLYGNKATLSDLDILVNNVGNQGVEMVRGLKNMPVNDPRILQENTNIVSWFSDDYFTGIGGDRRTATKTFEHTSGIRNQISKLISNKYVSRVLNPPKNVDLKDGDYIDFDKVLREGGVISITSAQGKLRDLSRFLGYFLILQIQSAVFRRPGTEHTRRGCALYIDEFQTYSNSGFSDMLTQGRSYRVACILATQNRALIGMNSGSKGKDFLELVSTNARNIIVFPGANVSDSEYFSKQFGQDLICKVDKTISRPRSIFAPNGRQSESIKETEKFESRFTSSDIVYQKFGEIIYSVIQNNTLQKPGAALIEFIPKELNEQINDFLLQHAQKYDLSERTQLTAEVIHNEKALSIDDDIDINFDELPTLAVPINRNELNQNETMNLLPKIKDNGVNSMENEVDDIF